MLVLNPNPNSSLPPIIPALVCLHLYIVGPLVHSTWLYSHFISHHYHYHCITHIISFHLLYTAYYCSIVSENKSPSSFHCYLVGFYRHSKSPHSSSLLVSHLIFSYVNIFCHSHFILYGNRYRYR